MKLKQIGNLCVVLAGLSLLACAPPPASKVDKTYGDSVRNMLAEQKRYPDTVVTDEPADGLTGMEADKIIEAYQQTLEGKKEERAIIVPGVSVSN